MMVTRDLGVILWGGEELWDFKKGECLEPVTWDEAQSMAKDAQEAADLYPRFVVAIHSNSKSRYFGDFQFDRYVDMIKDAMLEVGVMVLDIRYKWDNIPRFTETKNVVANTAFGQNAALGFAELIRSVIEAASVLIHPVSWRSKQKDLGKLFMGETHTALPDYVVPPVGYTDESGTDGPCAAERPVKEAREPTGNTRKVTFATPWGSDSTMKHGPVLASRKEAWKPAKTGGGEMRVRLADLEREGGIEPSSGGSFLCVGQVPRVSAVYLDQNCNIMAPHKSDPIYDSARKRKELEDIYRQHKLLPPPVIAMKVEPEADNIHPACPATASGPELSEDQILVARMHKESRAQRRFCLVVDDWG